MIKGHPLTAHRSLQGISKYIGWLVSSKTGFFTRKQYLNGTTLTAQRGASSLMHAYFLGLPEFDEMSFLIHYLRSDDNFVDVGANMGIYSLLACSYAGCACESFEPVPQTYKALKANMSNNGFANKVDVKNLGIGDQEGQLYFTKNFGTTNRVVNNPEQSQIASLVQVNVKALDDAIESKNVKLIKIDVEGYEWNVLKGATEVLSNDDLWALIVEINGRNEQFGVAPEQILDYLSSFGFKPYKYRPFDRALAPEEAFTDENRNTIFIRESKLDEVAKRLQDASVVNINGKAI